MLLEHVAIWTLDIERLRIFYERYFGACCGPKYTNPVTLFESYFLTFESGSRLEIMHKPNLHAGAEQGDNSKTGITHLAFGVASMNQVDEKRKEFEESGIEITRGPRKTGDGYYEFELADPDGNRLEVASEYK